MEVELCGSKLLMEDLRQSDLSAVILMFNRYEAWPTLAEVVHLSLAPVLHY